MLPGNFDFVIQQNTTRTFYLVWWKNKQTGERVDLTGYEAKLQIRKTFESEALVTLQSDEYGGGLNITPTEGKIAVEFAASLTGLPFGTYRHDLYLYPTTPGELPVLCLFRGAVRFGARVTHA